MTDEPYELVVKNLIDLIHRNGWASKFEGALIEAGKYNIPSIKDVQTLEQYYSWLNNNLLEIPSEDPQGKKMYNRICEFYFFIDQPSVLDLQNKIQPEDKAPDLTELESWMVDYANAWGRICDEPRSLTKESLQTFIDSPRYNVELDYIPAPGGWKTFNQFFARHTRPGRRPVADISDDKVIVSPADSTFVDQWTIDSKSEITVEVEVKNIKWSIHELLEGSPYKDSFQGGVFTHSFLNTTDYHRLHVPVRGKVLESRTIHGQVYLDVHAEPDREAPAEAGSQPYKLVATRHFGARDANGHHFGAQDGTGYQFAQSRGLIVLESPIGKVAVLPIGMAQVSSVVMTAEEGAELRKGEEFAYFQFGGSDHIILFDSKCNVKLSAKTGTHYNQGMRIGTGG